MNRPWLLLAGSARRTCGRFLSPVVILPTSSPWDRSWLFLIWWWVKMAPFSFEPANGTFRTLSPPPPKEFVDELSRRQVSPLGVGHSIVDTREPHHITVLEVIKEQGLELEIIFNKGAVMILPSGVNKASGLQAALQALGLSPETVIGVGDAENDHAFLEICGLPVAVANAVPALKTKAALVTQHSAGAGVTELIESALRGDLDTHVRVAADIPTANTPATAQWSG